MYHVFESLSGSTRIAIVLISLIAVALHVRWSRTSVMLGPTLLTTFGIFFCFLGIAWGLMNFDPADVKNSVPQLLQGIRTSFWASVFGIGWALTIKLRVLIAGGPSLPEGAPAGATIDDLAEQLARLNQSLAGSGESTVLGQVKGLRADSSHRLDRLNQSFVRFAENVAETNAKALVQALSEVIKDFNTKLNEQFGDNFKSLDAAVQRLVVWQHQYERQLNALIEQETATRKSMTESALRFATLVEKSTVFTTTAASLSDLMSVTKAQSDELHISLHRLAELVTAAATGLPQIEIAIVHMTQQIEQGVRANQDMLGAVLKTSAQSIHAHGQELTDLLKSTIATANADLDNHLRAATDASTKQIAALDNALEAELTKALETLGRQLTALSGKFVQDYTPLTQKLQQLVQAARV